MRVTSKEGGRGEPHTRGSKRTIEEELIDVDMCVRVRNLGLYVCMYILYMYACVCMLMHVSCMYVCMSMYAYIIVCRYICIMYRLSLLIAFFIPRQFS